MPLKSLTRKDHPARQAETRAFFGATVRYANPSGAERVVEHRRRRRGRSQPEPYQLGVTSGARVAEVGSRGHRSSRGTGGTEHLKVLEVRYDRIAVEPFREPAGSEAQLKRTPPPTLT